MPRIGRAAVAGLPKIDLDNAQPNHNGVVIDRLREQFRRRIPVKKKRLFARVAQDPGKRIVPR